MKKSIVFALVLSGSVMFMGCKKKKDEEPAPAAKSKTELLTANSWIVSASTADKSVDYDGDGNSSTNVYSQMGACEKDDFLSFSNTNNVKTGAYDDGASQCDSSDPQTVSFTWSFNSNETVLTVSFLGGAYTQEYTVVQLDANTLKVSHTEQDDNNLSYVQTDTMVKK